jgi:hypothetical protein
MQQLQSSENMTDWTNVGLPVLGTGQPFSVFDTSTEQPAKFYRVVAQ